MILKDLLQHFGLHSVPFARAVPKGALLAHQSFNETLTRLRFAIESRTAAMVTAEPGLGLRASGFGETAAGDHGLAEPEA